MIELKKDIDRKKIPENENLNKIVDIVKRILDFYKEQNGKGLPRILALRPSDLVHKRSLTVRSLTVSILKYYLLNKCFKDYQ